MNRRSAVLPTMALMATGCFSPGETRDANQTDGDAEVRVDPNDLPRPMLVEVTGEDGQATISWQGPLESWAGTAEATYNVYWSTVGGSGTDGTRVRDAQSPEVVTGLDN